MGKFENIDADFSKITKHLRIENIVLPQKNKGHHKHYSTYYNPRTIDVIGTRFERDIVAFDYKFDYQAVPK